jgi:hypothetical protein
MDRRRTWDELSPERQAFWTEAVDLYEGETMADWWEILNECVAEDHSYETEGWPA